MFWLDDFLNNRVDTSRNPYPKAGFTALKEIIAEWKNSEHIHFQTSGSTGNPKSIRFRKNQVLASCQQTQKAFNLNANTACLCPLGLQYVAGKMMVLRALALDLPLFICSPQDVDKTLAEHTFYFVPLVPLQLENLIATGANHHLPEQVLMGGSAVGTTVLEKRSKLPQSTTVWHGYGMTETLTHVALRRIHPEYQPAFTPLPNIGISSLNGQAEIKAPYLDSPVITNDLIQLEENGSFVILGRSDWIINSGGHKINPTEIEDLLAALLDVPFFIHGMADAKLGQKAVLICEGKTDLTKDELAAYLSDKTHQYNIPKEIYCIPQFERSAGGKILRLKSASYLP